MPNSQLCAVCTMTRNRVLHLPKLCKFSYHQFFLFKPGSHPRRAEVLVQQEKSNELKELLLKVIVYVCEINQRPDKVAISR